MAKTYLQRIAEVVAKKHDLSLKDAEDFVSTMFAVVHEGLDEDKQVKIKGLGTFSVKAVKARESVNVNTGERVTIDGHDKVSFTPDKVMAELVNKPFAHFETVVLNDGVVFADEEEKKEAQPAAQEQEVVPAPTVEQSPTPIEKPAPAEPSKPKDKLETTEAAELPKTPETSKPSEPLENPVPSESPAPEEPTDAPGVPDAPAANHRRIWALVILGLLIVAAIAAYFWYNHQQDQKPLPPLSKEMVDGPTKAKKPVKKVQPQQPKDSVAALVEKANADPRVRAGAYNIVGIDTIVTLKGKQTMHSYCKHTLGELMIVYFQALNGKDSMQAGEQLKVPKVRYKSRTAE